MRPRHRLDLLWLPDDPHRALCLDAFAALKARWEQRGWLEGVTGAPAGGFVALRLDDPGRTAFYANQIGGFRVFCPRVGENLVPGFLAAMRSWRQGKERSLSCPHCGETHDLAALRFAPQAGFARGAVVLAGVQQASVRPEVAAELDTVTGPSVQVLRRPS